MPFISCSADGTDHLANLRRLVISRWVVLAAMFLLVMMAPGALDIPVQEVPLFSIIAITLIFNTIAHWRLRKAHTATPYELFSQLLIDISALSALIFFSGGATNPLVSLLLPPVAIAALTLPTRCVIAIGAAAVTAYSLLMVFYIPLPMPDATRATRLHLIGMWLTFVVSAAMIAWFVVRMTRLIRLRDAELAAAREQALRDERVIAMGTLAAGAAHELGTPLGTMALLAGELAREFSSLPTLPQTVRDDVALLRQQIGVCKDIITALSRRAGAERLENATREPADRWLDAIRQHWQAVRPQASCRLILASDGQPPRMLADPRLEQAVLNLLNNAANASKPLPLELRLSWSSREVCIEVRDHGPGFPQTVLERVGQASFPPHERGSGIGLMLTIAAIEQMGGRLTLCNPDEGGALARIDLPLATP